MLLHYCNKLIKASKNLLLSSDLSSITEIINIVEWEHMSMWKFNMNDMKGEEVLIKELRLIQYTTDMQNNLLWLSKKSCNVRELVVAAACSKAFPKQLEISIHFNYSMSFGSLFIHLLIQWVLPWYSANIRTFKMFTLFQCCYLTVWLKSTHFKIEKIFH